MLEKLIDLITGQMDELIALLALHVIAVAVLAVLSAYVFVTCGRFLIDDVLINKAVSGKTVQAPVDSCLSDIDPLIPEMIGYLLARKMGSLIILKEIQDLARLLGII